MLGLYDEIPDEWLEDTEEAVNRLYIRLGLERLLYDTTGNKLLCTLYFWHDVNKYLQEDIIKPFQEISANHFKSAIINQDDEIIQNDQPLFVSCHDFFNSMRHIDERSMRIVIEKMDGLNLLIKTQLLDSVLSNDYQTFEKIVGNTDYDFSTSSKYAMYLYLIKKTFVEFYSNTDSYNWTELMPEALKYICKKFPHLNKYYDVFMYKAEDLDDNKTEEINEIIGYLKWISGIVKADIDKHLSYLPEHKQKLFISSIPPDIYEIYKTIEIPEDNDLFGSLIFNDDEVGFALKLEQQQSMIKNTIVDNNANEKQENPQIDVDKMKKVFKAIYWDGLDDNPNANVDTLVMYIKDLKSDTKAKSVDYARIAYIIFGCEYFIEENPDTGRAWTFSAWYKHFCDICDVKYNDNYKDYSNIIPENPKYIKFQRILPKRKK